jgi:hypothetical protein
MDQDAWSADEDTMFDDTAPGGPTSSLAQTPSSERGSRSPDARAAAAAADGTAVLSWQRAGPSTARHRSAVPLVPSAALSAGVLAELDRICADDAAARQRALVSSSVAAVSSGDLTGPGVGAAAAAASPQPRRRRVEVPQQPLDGGSAYELPGLHILSVRSARSDTMRTDVAGPGGAARTEATVWAHDSKARAPDAASTVRDTLPLGRVTSGLARAESIGSPAPSPPPLSACSSSSAFELPGLRIISILVAEPPAAHPVAAAAPTSRRSVPAAAAAAVASIADGGGSAQDAPSAVVVGSARIRRHRAAGPRAADAAAAVSAPPPACRADDDVPFYSASSDLAIAIMDELDRVLKAAGSPLPPTAAAAAAASGGRSK